MVQAPHGGNAASFFGFGGSRAMAMAKRNSRAAHIMLQLAMPAGWEGDFGATPPLRFQPQSLEMYLFKSRLLHYVSWGFKLTHCEIFKGSLCSKAHLKSPRVTETQYIPHAGSGPA